MPDLQIAATANANGVAFNVLRCGAAAFQVSGTFSATVNFEATIDQTNWFAISVTNVTTNVSATTTTTTGAYVANCAAFVLVRARISGYVSGTVSVFAEAAAGGGVGTVGGSSSSSTQYTDGGAAVPNGTGTAPIWFDGSRIPQDVSPTTPMPQTRYTSAGVEIGLPANPDTVQGPIAPGSALAGTRPVLAGGSDGTNARTFSTLTDGTLNTFNTAALNPTDDTVGAVGNVAHDAVDSGSPVKIGGKARTTNPTAVSDGDRVDAMYDTLGKQVVVIGAPRALRVPQTTTITSSTSETTILTDGGVGVLLDLSLLTIANTSATDTNVEIRDATGGSIILEFAVKAGTTSGIAAPQSIPQTTAHNNWTAKSSASVASLVIYAQANKVV